MVDVTNKLHYYTNIMIPFAIKTRLDKIWIWQSSEIFKIECTFANIATNNKWWDRQYALNCLVFLDKPTNEQLQRNIRCKLFHNNIEG